MEQRFHTAFCMGSIVKRGPHSSSDVIVTFTIAEEVDEDIVYYVAAAPAMCTNSMSGSGLPFIDSKQAFDRTPNKGYVLKDARTGTFTIRMSMPNSYYAGLGTLLIKPKVYIYYKTRRGHVKRSTAIQLSRGIPYRSLTYPMNETDVGRKDPMFYSPVLFQRVRSQEQILRDSAYPAQDEMAPDFWGDTPSV